MCVVGFHMLNINNIVNCYNIKSTDRFGNHIDSVK